LVYDKRGVGDSGGHYEGENNTSQQSLDILATDASNAVTFMASQPGVTRHVGLFGVSQGGWIAPMAAQRNPRVKFLILHSGPVVSVREQNYFARLTGEGHSSVGIPITDADARLRTIRPGGFDPRPVLAHLDATALWLFRDADNSVPVRESVTYLQPLITSGKTFEYRLFHGDHLILTRSTRFSGLNEQYWDTIVDWMKRHKGRDLEEHAKL
jgi:pimeloyl-ACP methyl ester carboxylesterase